MEHKESSDNQENDSKNPVPNISSPNTNKTTNGGNEHYHKKSRKIELFALIINFFTLIIVGKTVMDSNSNFMTDNRAYLLPTNINFQNGSAYDSLMEVDVKNVGKTSALKIQISEIIFSKEPINKIDAPMQPTKYAFITPNEIPSLKTISNVPYYKLAPDWDIKVFFAGQIIYYDIFNNFHITKFGGTFKSVGSNPDISFEGELNETQ